MIRFFNEGDLMDAKFWIEAWNEGRTGFHQEIYHPKLLEYFPQLHVKGGQTILVPLSGKTKDLLWLQDQGLKVLGVELHKKAVEEFFQENNLSPVTIVEDVNFINFSSKNISVSCGDFFKLNRSEEFDFIYDRASLVALPESMRKRYAETIKDSLKVGGKYLLIVYEYDQTKLEGPPFSVGANEINQLYAKDFSIKLLESKPPVAERSRLAAIDGIRQNVYLLEKVRS
jgi:thiopurine S-methyltransferase